MATEHEYICDNCGRLSSRDLLVVKKTVFTTMGVGGKTIRSRVKQWLCTDCTKSDPDWNLPKYRPSEDRHPEIHTRTDDE